MVLHHVAVHSAALLHYILAVPGAALHDTAPDL